MKGVHRLIGGVPISLGIGIRRGSRRRLGLAKGIGYPLARGAFSPRFGEGISKIHPLFLFELVAVAWSTSVDIINIWYGLKISNLDLGYGISMVVLECMVSLFLNAYKL